MAKERLGNFIQEYSVKNKKNLGYPVYSVTNSQGFCTEYFNKDVSGEDKTTYKIVPRGYFAYNPSRINVGSIDWQNSEDNVIVSPLYVVFKCSDGLNQDYLKYYLKSDSGKRTINARVSGAVRNNLKFSILSDFELNIGSVDEQLSVVTKLKTIEHAIEEEIHQIKLYDELIKTRFAELFGNPVSNEKGWKKQPLKDVCLKLNDGTHCSPESFETGDYKYVTAKNIKLDGFDFSNITYVPESVHRPIYERCNPEIGDVLYIKDGATTGVAMVNTLDEEFTLLSSVALLKQNRKVMNGIFLCSLLNSREMYADIRSNMGGVAITRLTISKLNSIKVIVPPIELQEKFATFVEHVDFAKEKTRKRIDLYRELLTKKTDELFNGESA